MCRLCWYDIAMTHDDVCRLFLLMFAAVFLMDIEICRMVCSGAQKTTQRVKFKGKPFSNYGANAIGEQDNSSQADVGVDNVIEKMPKRRKYSQNPSSNVILE